MLIWLYCILCLMGSNKAILNLEKAPISSHLFSYRKGGCLRSLSNVRIYLGHVISYSYSSEWLYQHWHILSMKTSECMVWVKSINNVKSTQTKMWTVGMIICDALYSLSMHEMIIYSSQSTNMLSYRTPTIRCTHSLGFTTFTSTYHNKN